MNPETKSKSTGGEWSPEAKFLGFIFCYDKMMYERANENSKPSKSEISLIYNPEICREVLTEDKYDPNKTEKAIEELMNDQIISGTLENFTLSKTGLDRRFEFVGVYFL